MKQYVKPDLTFLALSGNSALCACSYDALGSNMDPNIRFVLEGFGIPEDEFQNCFAYQEACSTKIDTDSFCKFGPSGALVFNS